MTVLRHQAPPGALVTVRPYSGNKYAPGQGPALTAVADSSGWAVLTLPDPGSRNTYWTVTRPGASPAVIIVPRGSATVTSTDVQLGTLDPSSDLVDTRQPPAQVSPADLAAAHDTDPERETYIPARLSDTALKAAYARPAGVAVVDSFGGDPTGATDSAPAFNAALASLPKDAYTGYPRGTVVFGAGTYRINSPLGNIGPSAHVLGQGMSETFLSFYGTGDCLTLYSSWFPSQSYAVPMENSFAGGGISALTVDGTNAGPGSTGIRFGDGIGQEIGTRGRVCVRHFTGANSIGIWQNSRVSWTEKAHVDAFVFDCTTNYKVSVSTGGTSTLAQAVTLPSTTVKLASLSPLFPRISPNGATSGLGIIPTILVGGQTVQYTGYTVNADGTVTLTGCSGGTGTQAAGATVTFTSTDGSMGYNTVRLDIGSNPGQDGVWIADGANFYGGELIVKGNMGLSSTAQTNACLRVAGGMLAGLRSANSPAQINAAHLNVQVEAYGTGSFAPYTLYIQTSPFSRIIGCIGIMYFGGTWQGSNITLGNVGQFTFLGPITGDATLNPSDNGTSKPAFMRSPVLYLKSSINPGGQGIGIHDGDFIEMTLAASGAMSFFGTALAGPRRVTVVLHQPGSGTTNYTVTWPTNASPSLSSPTVKWAGGVAPVMSTGANATDVYYLDTVDGKTWYGRAAQAVA